MEFSTCYKRATTLRKSDRIALIQGNNFNIGKKTNDAISQQYIPKAFLKPTMSVHLERDFQWIIWKEEGVVSLQQVVGLHGVGVWCMPGSIKSEMVGTTWGRWPR